MRRAASRAPPPSKLRGPRGKWEEAHGFQQGAAALSLLPQGLCPCNALCQRPLPYTATQLPLTAFRSAQGHQIYQQPLRHRALSALTQASSASLAGWHPEGSAVF